MKFLLLTVLGLLTGSVSAEEDFPPHPHRADRVGERLAVEANTQIKTEIQGSLLDDDDAGTVSGKFAAELEILAVGRHGRSAIKATLQKAEISCDGDTFLIFAPGDVVAFSVEGKSEQITVNGKPPGKMQQTTIRQIFPVAGDATENRFWAASIPGRKVKVGEQWKPDMAKWLRPSESNPSEKMAASGFCRLDKVVEREGKRFMQITTEMTVSVNDQRQHGDLTITQVTITTRDEGEYSADATGHVPRRKRTVITETTVEGEPDGKEKKESGTQRVEVATEISERPVLEKAK